MRKIILFFIITLISINTLLSNPIPSPCAMISELLFDEHDEWFLEINIYASQNGLAEFDSICVETSNGFSRIRLDNIANSANLLVVTSDSLTNPLLMNRAGDYVKLYSYRYSSTNSYSTLLRFGNFPGSIIDSIQIGYSIVKIFPDIFAKDKCPSIGLPNDTVGTCGLLSGHIYDKNNKLVTEGTFGLVPQGADYLDCNFSILNDSTYLTNVYSRKATYNHLYFHHGSMPAYLDIDTIELNINPGVVYEKDIHILEDFSGVKENTFKPEYEISVINYPNPFNTSTNFAITIPFSQKYRQKQINIYNTLGQKINSITISNQSSVQWDGKDNNGNTAATGIYYYQLVLDNRTYKSGSMILLK
jgi:hypothetical protein